MTHICVSRLTVTGSDNGLSPGRRQAIIWTIAGILLIGPLGTNFSENLIEILTFSLTKMRLNVSSAKWRPFCLGLNVLIQEVMIDKELLNSSTPFRPMQCYSRDVNFKQFFLKYEFWQHWFSIWIYLSRGQILIHAPHAYIHPEEGWV